MVFGKGLESNTGTTKFDTKGNGRMIYLMEKVCSTIITKNKSMKDSLRKVFVKEEGS
jgi:hypothetical protein